MPPVRRRPSARRRGTARGRPGRGARRTGGSRNVSREPVDCGHYVFTAARRRADEDRGFAASSAALGLIGRRSIARSSGS